MRDNAPRRFAPLPLAVLAVCAAFTTATPVLALLTRDTRDDTTGTTVGLVLAALLLTWAVVGALTASRHPRNPVGWLFLVGGVIFGVGPFLDLYAASVTTDGDLLPGREHVGWLGSLLLNNAASFGLFGVILLLFPNGVPLSRRWGRFMWVVAGGAIVFTGLFALRPGELTEVEPTTFNPLGLDIVEPVWNVVELPLFLLFVVSCLAGVATLVVRFRRAQGVERQQLKWLAAGAGGLVSVTLTGPTLFWQVDALEPYWPFVFIPALTFLPLTAGFAILRYRLFEIDRIISRTVSYGLVVVVLAGVYVGTTLLASTILRPVVGGGDLPVAAATLVAAAGFRPLHRRIRAVVERRFNRRRYDAERAIAGFGQALRSELDRSEIAGSVRALVATTFEPDQVSLWLPTHAVRGGGLR